MTALDTKALLTGVTPGPWLDAVSDTHDGRLAIWADGGLAGVTQIAVLPPEFKAVKANARLIASAPRLARRVIELEEALKLSLPSLEEAVQSAEARWELNHAVATNPTRVEMLRELDAAKANLATARAALKGEGDE